MRKVLGGGMRQVGVLAAAGIVSLTDMVGRLSQDHDNAKRLADGLAHISGITIDPASVRTNIVYFHIPRAGLSAPDLVQRLDEAGVRMLPTGQHQIRAVTQYHVTAADIDAALAIIQQALAGKETLG